MALSWPPGCLLAAQTVALSGCHRHPGDPVHPSNSVLLSTTTRPSAPFPAVFLACPRSTRAELRCRSPRQLLRSFQRAEWPVFITRPRCSCHPQPVVYPHPSRPLFLPVEAVVLWVRELWSSLVWLVERGLDYGGRGGRGGDLNLKRLANHYSRSHHHICSQQPAS